MRRLFFALLIFILVGPVPGTVMRFPVNDLTEAAAARPLVFAPSDRGPMRFERGWRLVSPHSRFGGFSALALTGPGQFQLIGDNGYATRLTLDVRGGVGSVRIRPLPTSTAGRRARRWPMPKRCSSIPRAAKLDRARGDQPDLAAQPRPVGHRGLPQAAAAARAPVGNRGDGAARRCADCAARRRDDDPRGRARWTCGDPPRPSRCR